MTTPPRTNWCFTVNQEAFEFQAELERLSQLENVRYICGQLERAPDTDRLHFQGYLQLVKKQRLSWLKANIHATAHFEYQRASSNIVARDYCKKSDTAADPDGFIEFGEFIKGRGQRTDLSVLVNAAKSGSSQRQLMEDHPNEFGRYVKFVDRAFSLHAPSPHPDGVTIKLYFGHPGTGKTRKAYDENPGIYTTPITNGTLWLDGYDRQEVCLLDDFSGSLSKMPLTATLRLLDRYPVQVPVKGSFSWWTPKTIIVTTNIHPFRWYQWKGREIQYEALIRRFDEVVLFTNDTEPAEQYLPEFFYDQELIWLPVEELTRPLPTPPAHILQEVVPPVGPGGLPERLYFY